MNGIMKVMDGSGDQHIMWDSQRPAEVDAARASFKALRDKGYNAYAVQNGERVGIPIREFDPNAEKIIMAPAMRGG